MALLRNAATMPSIKWRISSRMYVRLNENDDAEETEIKGLVKMLNPKYNPDWEEARFLGRGTVTVSQIFYTPPVAVQWQTPARYLLTAV